jgi:hypothetical protein
VTGFCLIGGQQYSNPVLSLLLLCARHFFFFSKMKKVGSQSPSSRGPERAAPDPRNGPMSARDTSSSNNTIEDTNVLSEVVENWVSAIEVWSDELSAENGSVSWDAPLTAGSPLFVCLDLPQLSDMEQNGIVLLVSSMVNID